MKRMTMIAAALLLAVCAQAGSIDWLVSGVGAIKNQAGSNMGGGVTVYLVLAGSEAGIGSAISAGTFSTGTSGVLGTGVTSAQSTIAQVAAQSAQLTAGTSYNYAVLVFSTPNAYTGSGSGYYKFSTAATANANPDADHTQFVTYTASSFSVPSWTSYTVVPEPTSMALLALGVAAIGLRRRFKK